MLGEKAKILDFSVTLNKFIILKFPVTKWEKYKQTICKGGQKKISMLDNTKVCQ